MIAYYTIEDDGENSVYDLKLHVAALTVMTYLTLGPGESETYELRDMHAWQQVYDDGTPVDVPGQYAIRGLLNTWDPYEPGSSTIELVDVEMGTAGVPEFSSMAVVAATLVIVALLILLRRRTGPVGP